MDRPPHFDIDLNKTPPPSPPREIAAPVVAPPPQLPSPANVQAQQQLAHQAREIALAYQRGEWWRSACAAAIAGSSLEVPPPSVLQSPTFALPPLLPSSVLQSPTFAPPQLPPPTFAPPSVPSPVLQSPTFAPPPLPPPPVLQSPTFAPLSLPPPPVLQWPTFSPPPLRPSPQIPPPANVVQAQLQLANQAREIVLAYHRGEWCRSAIAATAAAAGSSEVPPPAPAQHPGAAGWGGDPCASCGLPELPASTIICDACERGFHESCVNVRCPPPPVPTPGVRVRRPQVAEDWLCQECEIGGARRAVPLHTNEVPVAVTVQEITRQVSVADGAHSTELATPHFEGLQLNSTTPFDVNHCMPAFDHPHCFSMRQQFPHVGQNAIADGNTEQRSNHSCCKRRDFPQISALPKLSEKNEFGSSSTFMQPSVSTKASAASPTEETNPPKPPKFLAETCNRQPHHGSVVLPVQYQDLFITNLGEIDKNASYHNCQQIWPVGFTSYWHDRVTGSLFECEVCDGGSSGPLFKVRRLPCSVSPLPVASTILSQNGARKVDTTETKESSSFIGDAANDMEDNIYMMMDIPSETNQDFLSCLANDTEDKRTSLDCNDVQSPNMMSQILPSNSENVLPSKEANIKDQIGEFTFEGTSSSSVWGMISSAMVEACEKMYKEHGHLVFSCTHSCENHLLNKGSGCQNFDGPYAPLTRFCSSNGPSIPRITEKKNDVESTYTLLKKWLYHDRIGLDLDFVQEIVESLPRSISCINYQFLCNRTEFLSSVTVASGLLLSVHKDGQSNGDTSYGRHGAVTGVHDHAQPSGSIIRELPPGRPISRKLQPESAADVFKIWEFLGRFAEIIHLKEVPSYEELEDELADPWPTCASQKESLSKGTEQCRDYSSPMNSPANASISHLNTESGLSNNEEIVSVFIPVETSSMKEAGLDKLAAQTLGRCTGTVLPGVHITLIKVLFGELLSKLNIDQKEPKHRRGRKKDTESLISTKEFSFDMLTANKLTWPELARRYMLAISSINWCMDVSDISSREVVKLFRCLQGDGGILCGAVSGVAGMEKDAQLLLEAENLICSSLPSEGNKVFMMGYKYSAEVPIADNRTLPDWAEQLEPVRKLPTNVGTRIRKCVYEALDRKPPEWARKILEHSVSKEVYKANACGPTKKAVLSVLSEACRVIVPQKPENPKSERKTISISEVILKKCRIALRQAISAHEYKLLGNLLGTMRVNFNEYEGEAILGFSGMVPRPLDFRIIDIRLAMGAYCGSWETFSEDVQEVIRNLQIIFANQTDVLQTVEEFSKTFESMYKTEVLDLVRKFDCYLSSENTGSEIQELHDIFTAATKLPKAPWEYGICKVCGIDRDDDNVLLCDDCDSEYHTYCLEPPLARIPKGDWFCPSCMLKKSHIHQGAQDLKRRRKGAESHAFNDKPSCMSAQKKSHLDQAVEDLKQQQKGAESRAFNDKPSCMSAQKKSHLDQGIQDLKQQRKGAFHDMLIKLAATVEQKEYWELSTQERIDTLKFLCDEMLNTVLIREHIEKCPDKLNDLQKKLHALNFELKDLKHKEEMRNSYAIHCSGHGENQHNEVAITSGHIEEADEMDTLSDQISKVQDSICTVESQLNIASLRRDFLGKDSLGRLYWVLGRSGKRPLLVADGSMLICKERDIYPPSTSDCKGWNSASPVIYESDEEITTLIDWLREYDPREKELKHGIQQRQRQRHHLGNFVLSDPPVLSKASNIEQQLMELPSTKAATILEKTCRCDCLERIWPGRHHCTTCHETYLTSTEYEGHAGKCNAHVNKEIDSANPSTTAESTKPIKLCPYDFEEICRKFVTNDSNKEIVKDIGLIGSNGVPSFVPSPAACVDPPVLLNRNKKDGIPNDDLVSSSLEECQAMSSEQNLGQEGSNSAQNCPRSTSCDENLSKSKEPAPDTETTSSEEATSSATDKPTRLLAVNGGLVPESALRPVTGRNSHILKQQKINLLDIDAALPEEALRGSKSQQWRRRSWRAFVKKAESISEMVVATSVLESMIKSEFLKNDWWYWPSFTTAIKTSTVSSLALRIYTLDDCIMYTKEPNTVPDDSTKVVNKGRRGKEPEPSAS
ncbi:LOW QUALITY PROTEIN: methyl-CpG-binding domain-containing protein 9-like [Hordeum vulgare subsp. vulgare]|uniref:LOW QUALITY PROTEIN: methyl-CpG-binding domain-containing protein 9-like n=1 Tax=Hordeum vulgare subsp. vulgare TaxID=112509 RepID=UPI001D1A593E|nr:LOW QUALITY PROTEIN: methyl-CpG-binding domain-containing protein 9-like [Hordeum vulgare subsp. vulgare]